MKINVAEKIKIENPTPTIEKWCRDNLIIDNPDYYKKEKMGKWTGNTPKTISLFEKVGNELWIPFGCVQSIWKMCMRGVSWNAEFCPIRAFDYDSHINLYSYQEKAVNEALKRKNGILVMPCGSGKTQSGLEVISKIGGRALWLTHTQDLLNQSKKRAESVFGNVGCGTITDGKVDIGIGITFATVQTLCKIDLTQYRDYWDVIIVDECMPSDTMIDTPTGTKKLKDLCIDDIITSYNRNTKKLENKRVKHVFKYKAHDVVKVKLSNGEEIICTSNHPIFTRDRQWIDAERLVHDDYVLRLVWEGSRNGHDAENIKTQSLGARLLLLLKRMFCKGRSQEGCVDGRTQEDRIRSNETHKRKISRFLCAEDEGKQSIKKSRNESKSFKAVKRNRSSSSDSMRKWNGINSTATNTDDCSCKKDECVCRISNTDKTGKRKWISNLLQNRHRNSRKDDCNRSGWKFTLCNRKTKTGSEKRPIFEWIRVDSVEIQKQTSDGTFGGLCSDGYVYNIEVEDNNNYFANGILVHNCQHCAGSPTKVTQFYKVMSNLCARYKIGLTATPKRADGLEISMFALLGGIMHEVSREEVAHTTCPIKVSQIPTGWYPTDDILNTDGTIDYMQVIDSMTHDDARFDVIMNRINEIPAGESIIVLANRVEYLQKLCDTYVRKSICLSGMGQSKKAKQERKEALQKLNDGELDCVFATYQLAKEGLDVPNLNYVVFATPEKDDTTVIQSAGRVGRKADGKDAGHVIDFVDSFGMYKGWATKRRGYYKKIGAEIE